MTKLYNRPMNFFEKLYSGWWWCISECWGAWVYCMTHPEDNGRDFFLDINIDYVGYEEDMYYD